MTYYALLARYDQGTDIQTGLKQVDVADASRSSDNVSNQVCLGCVCQASQNMAKPWLLKIIFYGWNFYR